MYDPTRLAALVAVAEAGSITRAAERLGYTPPALSQQLAKLERETGTALLVRDARVGDRDGLQGSRLPVDGQPGQRGRRGGRPRGHQVRGDGPGELQQKPFGALESGSVGRTPRKPAR